MNTDDPRETLADTTKVTTDGLAAAEARWGALVPRAEAEAYLAARAAPGACAPERVAELYLCCACAAGHAGALGELERRYIPEIDRALHHLDRDGDLIDEVKQRLRHKLLVATRDAPAGIVRFRGSGPLGRWLQVVATRDAIVHLRSAMRARARDVVDLAPCDLEPAVLRREYHAHFEVAFAQALAKLSGHDRHVLYDHLVGRFGPQRIARMHGVHRVTAFRWLRAAQDALVAHTRACLVRAMDLAPGELGSVLGLIRSQASVSVERLLRTLEDPAIIDDCASTERGGAASR